MVVTANQCVAYGAILGELIADHDTIIYSGNRLLAEPDNVSVIENLSFAIQKADDAVLKFRRAGNIGTDCLGHDIQYSINLILATLGRLTANRSYDESKIYVDGLRSIVEEIRIARTT